MTTNILKVDIGRLSEELCRFHIKNNIKPYVIGSKDTLDIIANESKTVYIDAEELRKSGKIVKFCGYKVLQDNTLPLGTIEIR